MNIRNTFLLFLFIHLLSCGTDPTADWKEQDLSSYGVPLTILAPDSIDVKVGELGSMKDITIKGTENFELQILGKNISTTNLESLLSEEKDYVKDERFFDAIEDEWDSGFIYKNVIDSNTISYDFRHIEVKGDKMYVYQAGILGTHTKEDIEMLLKAIRKEAR